MNDEQVFETRKQAQAEIEKIIGWDAKPVKQVRYDDNGERADVWVIRCDKNKYLRTDGYVR